MKTVHNPLTAWIHAFLSNRPEAKPVDGWEHLVETAQAFPLVLDWLIGFDAEHQAVIYRRSHHTTEQRLNWDSFKRQFNRVRQLRPIAQEVET